MVRLLGESAPSTDQLVTFKNGKLRISIAWAMRGIIFGASVLSTMAFSRYETLQSKVDSMVSATQKDKEMADQRFGEIRDDIKEIKQNQQVQTQQIMDAIKGQQRGIPR